MSDGVRVDAGNGPEIDTHEITGPGAVLFQRQRVQLAGDAYADTVSVTSNALNVYLANAMGLAQDSTLTSGTQKTQIVFGGSAVASNHPLPVAAVFSDNNGTPYSVGNPLPVSVGDLSVQNLTVSFPNSVISTLNSTTSLLAAGATFTGQWEDVSKFSAISAIVMTDVYSAVNGARVDFSSDGATVLRSIAATIPPSTGLTFMFAPEARYFRLVYTNGATAQGTFYNQVVLHYQTPTPPQLPLAATTSDLSLAMTVASHVKGRQSNGIYIPLNADSSGNLGVRVNNFPATQTVSGTVAVSSGSVVVAKTPNVGTPVVVNTNSLTTIYTPASGKSIKLNWLGLASPDTNGASVVATVKLGSTTIYQWPLGAPGAFAHSGNRVGAPDAPLTVQLSASGQTVYVNPDIEEI